MRLENKVAVVTGGTEGLGLATARLFQDEGAKVVICGRRQEKLDDAAALLGDGCLAVQCDVSKIADLDRLYEATGERFGKVDVLVANASVFKAMPLGQMTEEFFDETVGVNLKGTYFTVQRAIEHLNDGASIVVVSSAGRYLGVGDVFSVYALTKAAIRQMARSFSSALVGRGIRVNTLSPGFMDTPIFGKTGIPGLDQIVQAQAEEVVPMQRWASPDEVARTALFLASDDSSYVIGIDLIADGGLSQFRGPPPQPAAQQQ